MADQNIIGGHELDAMLKTLAPKIEKKILRGGLRAGVVPIRDEARANVPVLDGALKKSVRISTGSKKGVVTASVKVGGVKAPHAALVEFGTRPHEILPKDAEALAIAGAVVRSVAHPGAAPHPFMRPAFDAKVNDAITATAAHIRKGLTLAGLNGPNEV